MLDSTKNLLNTLKDDFALFPEPEQGLDLAFESIVKHLANYKKIIEPHLGDLERILHLEPNQPKTLADLSLPESIQQLQKLLRILSEKDLEMCEALLHSAQEYTVAAENKAIESPAIKSAPVT